MIVADFQNQSGLIEETAKNYLRKFLYVVAKNGWENILPETQGLVESGGKKISKIHSLVCPKGEGAFVAAILLVGR